MKYNAKESTYEKVTFLDSTGREHVAYATNDRLDTKTVPSIYDVYEVSLDEETLTRTITTKVDYDFNLSLLVKKGELNDVLLPLTLDDESDLNFLDGRDYVLDESGQMVLKDDE